MVMGEATIKLGADVEHAKKTGKDAADAIGKSIEERIQLSSQVAADQLKKVFEKAVPAGVDPLRLRGVLKSSFTRLSRDAQVRTGLERISKTVAATMGEGVKSEKVVKAMEEAVTQSHKRGWKESVSKFFGGRGGKGGGGAGEPSHFLDQEGKASVFGGRGAGGAARAAGYAGWGAATGWLPRGGMGVRGLPANIGAHGAVGGLGVTGAQMAGAGLGQTIGYGQTEEQIGMSALPYMQGGGRGMGKLKGVLGRGRGMKFSATESAGMYGGMLRQGTGGGIDSMFRAQREYGMGGDFGGMLGAQAMRGGDVTKASSKRMLEEAVAAGMASGLSRGRWGEVARGMSDMIRSRGLGMSVGGVMGKGGALARLSGAFKGGEAFEAMQGMERFAKGGATPLGQAVSLQAAGLGRGGPGGAGGDIFKAMRQQELGLFGRRSNTGTQSMTGDVLTRGGKEREGIGPGGFDFMLRKVKEAFMGRSGAQLGKEITGEGSGRMEMQRGAALKELSANMGITASATEELVNAWEEGKRDPDDLKQIIKRGKPLEQQAYSAIVGMAHFKGLETKVEAALATYWSWMKPGFNRLVDDIGDLVDMVRSFAGDRIKEGTQAKNVSKMAVGKTGQAVAQILEASMGAGGGGSPEEQRALILLQARRGGGGKQTKIGGLSAQELSKASGRSMEEVEGAFGKWRHGNIPEKFLTEATALLSTMSKIAETRLEKGTIELNVTNNNDPKYTSDTSLAVTQKNATKGRATIAGTAETAK